MTCKYFKSAEITPTTVLAGDSVEFTIKLTAGSSFSADNTRIILDMPGYLGTSRPTRYHQEQIGFVEVFCSNPDIKYTQNVWDIETGDFTRSGKSSFKGMAQRMYVLDFLEGKSNEGDIIEVKWGYTCNGFGTGIRVASIVPLKDFFNTIHLRYFKDCRAGLPDYARSFKGYDRPIPDEEIPLKYLILPREPEKIRIIRRKTQANLLIMDRFFNITQNVGSIDEYINENILVKENSHGAFEVSDANVKVSAKKLPFYDTPSMIDVYQGYNIFFGDLHTHTSYSNDCIEREKLEITPDMSFKFANNAACLDFLAVTDHHQPWDKEKNKIGKDKWDLTIEAVNNNNKPGEFIVFPGFEFRCERGDTAVILNEHLSYKQIDIPSIRNVKDLWQEFKSYDFITIPHFHNPGKLPLGEWYKCPYEGVETLLEIFSCHGSYERDDVIERHVAEIKEFRSDRHGRYFLEKGYKYGFCCNSDGHKGNPGFNGLTAVYAKELTRDGILEAIRNRRVYGTTNARIKLIFTINGELMGSIVKNTEKMSVSISLTGERSFKAVDVFKNGILYKRFRPNSLSFKTEFNVNGEEPSNWYVRGIQIDNHIAYSSPIWCE